MLAFSQIRFPVRIGAVSLVTLLLPMTQVDAISQPRMTEAAYAGSGLANEIRLPVEMQTSLFHSLPIAGHMVTPDQVAERVMTNPRLRVTAGLPYSGKGTANPIYQSGVADTHADPLAVSMKHVRGAGRAPKP
jgi:hypothetical protein